MVIYHSIPSCTSSACHRGYSTVLHPGETSLESHERWTKFLYPTGLLLIAAIMVLLGVWGWNGAGHIGMVWPALGAIVLVIGFTALALTILVRL